MQHIVSLMKIDGRTAVVVPDNVLFEGGAGEKVLRNLLQKCRVPCAVCRLLQAGRLHERKPTWNEHNPEGRWRAR